MTRILVVDDEHLLRTPVAAVLRQAGYVVECAASGEEALRALESAKPELILLDLMMPGMDGWDLRHEQKRDPRIADIPVIAVSAAGKLPDADVQFRKPLDLDKFLAAVKQYVQPRRPRT